VAIVDWNGTLGLLDIDALSGLIGGEQGARSIRHPRRRSPTRSLRSKPDRFHSPTRGLSRLLRATRDWIRDGTTCTDGEQPNAVRHVSIGEALGSRGHPGTQPAFDRAERQDGISSGTCPSLRLGTARFEHRPRGGQNESVDRFADHSGEELAEAGAGSSVWAFK
jgi:hypothetical protein